MKKLTTLLLTATLTLTSGALYAATGDTGSSTNNGQANANADAGAHAPDAHKNLAPNHVDNSKINEGNTNTATGSTMSGDDMSKSEIHKNTMCKDGKCPDMNKKVETQQGSGDVNTKTDGTSQ